MHATSARAVNSLAGFRLCPSADGRERRLARIAPPLSLALLLAACGAGTDGAAADCAAAAAHVEGCFPGRAAPVDAACSAADAERVLAASCEDLATAGDGKSDSNAFCIWTPWLCAASLGGGSAGASSSANRLEVSVEECGGSYIDDCAYVTSAPCARVTVRKGGKAVTAGYTSGGGRLTFPDLGAGDYELSVLDRSGRTAKMIVGDLALSVASARQKVSVSGGEQWVRFRLQAGTADAVRACSDVRGTLDVTAASGAAIDRHDVEWAWLASLHAAGADAALDVTRPLFFHHEATQSGEDENVVAFSQLFPGRYTVRFQPMDIPSFAQRPNPDYAELLRRYADDAAAPTEFTLTVNKGDVPADLETTFEVVDARR